MRITFSTQEHKMDTCLPERKKNAQYNTKEHDKGFHFPLHIKLQ